RLDDDRPVVARVGRDLIAAGGVLRERRLGLALVLSDLLRRQLLAAADVVDRAEQHRLVEALVGCGAGWNLPTHPVASGTTSAIAHTSCFQFFIDDPPCCCWSRSQLERDAHIEREPRGPGLAQQEP